MLREGEGWYTSSISYSELENIFTEILNLFDRLADLLERDMLIVANLEALDNGKTFKSACGDVFHSVGCLRYYAGYADKITGKTIPADYGFFAMTRREPIGKAL